MGRKAKITEEKFIQAVIKTRGFNDANLGLVLRVTRGAIYKYKLNHPDVVKEAQKQLNEITKIRFDTRFTDKKMYFEIPLIKKWLRLMEGRELSADLKQSRLNCLYNVCKHLEVHPENLTLEMVSDLIIDIKNMDKAPRGLAYSYIRKPIRSYFELIHGVSGELLSTMGIKADRINMGAWASEFVSNTQRKEFESCLYDMVTKVIKKPELRDIVHNEILGSSQFMFYTATRIGAVTGIDMIDRKHKVNDTNIIEIHVLDKGGLHWNKKLIGEGITKFRNYTESIGINDLSELTSRQGKLFPWMSGKPANLRHERKIMRMALEHAGVIDLIQPNHIWRHTFAQEALRASNWNYEIVASLGGWSTSEELKKSYGKMGDDVLNRGLRAMMGLTVATEKYPLRW